MIRQLLPVSLAVFLAAMSPGATAAERKALAGWLAAAR